MFPLSVLALAFVAGGALAKQCINITVPVQISARNGVFNVPTLQSNLDATTFTQNLTSIRGNFSETSLLDYTTVTGNYSISAKFCKPDNEQGTNPTVQVLTHGIGFDKTYWDIPFNNFNYSYIDVAVDQFGYCTLSIDRLGIGNSSIADPLNVIQAPAELSALHQVTMMLRKGTLPSVPHAFTKIVSVGHSFGSALSYGLAAMDPTATDALILTGYSANSSFIPATFASWDSKLARLNQPLRFGNVTYAAVQQVLSMYGNVTTAEIDQYLAQFNIDLAEVEQVVRTTDLLDFIAGIEPTNGPHMQDLPTGYLTWVDPGSNQFAFLFPGHFDPEILTFAETHKQPYTVGELLTINGSPPSAPMFTGPVQIVTGNEDFIFCGGDCMQTGDPSIPSIPAAARKLFPATCAFEAYIQPNTGHAINVHYNSTRAYLAIQQFLNGQGLAPT